uniref:Globin domain-containing protein n=2 Tax=Clytia hemisphaerica TaxID=252671 RepID=A0A7M5XFD5_9CNID
TLYPQLRYMFRSLPEDIQFEDLFKTDALKMHVDKVRDVLELLINKIDNVEELVNTLVDFGRQHHMLGAEQRYATALAASFQYGICMIMDVDSSVENAWDSLLRFVMDLLKLGMRMEKEAQEKESLNKGYNTEELLEKAQDGGEALDENENSAPMPLALINEDDSTSSVRTFHVAEADPDG